MQDLIKAYSEKKLTAQNTLHQIISALSDIERETVNTYKPDNLRETTKLGDRLKNIVKRKNEEILRSIQAREQREISIALSFLENVIKPKAYKTAELGGSSFMLEMADYPEYEVNIGYLVTWAQANYKLNIVETEKNIITVDWL